MREKKQYPYAEIRNFTAGRRTRSFQKENDKNGTSSSSSDDEFTPKYKKSYGENINAKFNAFMDRICEELIEADNVLFKNRKIFPKFVLAHFSNSWIKNWTDDLFISLSVESISHSSP